MMATAGMERLLPAYNNQPDPSYSLSFHPGSEFEPSIGSQSFSTEPARCFLSRERSEYELQEDPQVSVLPIDDHPHGHRILRTGTLLTVGLQRRGYVGTYFTIEIRLMGGYNSLAV